MAHPGVVAAALDRASRTSFAIELARVRGPAAAPQVDLVDGSSLR